MTFRIWSFPFSKKERWNFARHFLKEPHFFEPIDAKVTNKISLRVFYISKNLLRHSWIDIKDSHVWKRSYSILNELISIKVTSSIFRKKINEMLTLAAGRTNVDDISNLKFSILEDFSFFEKKHDTFSFVVFRTFQNRKTTDNALLYPCLNSFRSSSNEIQIIFFLCNGACIFSSPSRIS